MEEFRWNVENFFKLVAIVLILWLIIIVNQVLLLFFIAIILASGLSRLAEFLLKYNIPKGVTLALAFIVTGGVVAGFSYLVLPTLIEELRVLIGSIPAEAEQLANQRFVRRIISPDQMKEVSSGLFRQLAGRLTDLVQRIFQVGVGLVDILISIITVIALTAYLVIEKTRIKDFLINVKYVDSGKAGVIFQKIQDRLSVWLGGQLLDMLAVGILTYLTLLFFDVPYSLSLAVLAALLEIVPFIGPTLAALPAVLITFTDSPVKALWLILAYFIIQQVETHILVPNIMKQVIGVSSVMIIMVVLIFTTLFGLLGTVLSVPFCVLLKIAWEEFGKG